MGYEAGPISAAEASRHLAILGVCSCALKNTVKKRHYYLAYHGIFERVDSHSGISSTQPLTGKATCISVDKRKAEAVTELLDQNGDTIIKLRVFYHVILDTTFERLYKDHFIEKPNFSIPNPYSIKHDYVSLKKTASIISASMGNIPECFCAGHFPNYPALPVAILAYNLFDMACRLLTCSLPKDTKVFIRSYEITADNLAFAGDDVSLQVEYTEQQGFNHHLSAEGTANGTKSIGRINMILEPAEQEELCFVQKNAYILNHQ